ncbi:hypothetical protein [Nocardioides ultimimeridianus]
MNTLQTLAAELLHTIDPDEDIFDSTSFADEVDDLVEDMLDLGAEDAEALVGLDCGEETFATVTLAAAEARLVLATMRARAA